MRWLVLVAGMASASASASGVYKEMCALCHDSGATGSVNLPEGFAPAASAVGAARPRPVKPVDDITLALAVADALVKAKIGGVKIEARDGRVSLVGMVENAAALKRALAAAQSVPGVREIDNRLASGETFEHD
jgi:osmotically-inducible protein OsmY